MEYDVRLENPTDHRPLAVVRRRASMQQLPKVVTESCGLVWGVLRAQQIKGAGRHVTLYLDDQTNIEVGVELDIPFAGFGEVVGSALPAGPVATATHFGPYNQLHRAHQAIRDWWRLTVTPLAGPSWEIYGHWDNAWNNDPSKIRTDVYLLATRRKPPA